MFQHAKLASAIKQCSVVHHRYAYAIDITSSGAKKFIVCDDSTFPTWYSSLPSMKHVHEVLLPDHQCHLFLDIEYKREKYPQAIESSIVDDAILMVKRSVLRSKFTKCQIILLCASDTVKMSWHIIFHGLIFHNICSTVLK